MDPFEKYFLDRATLAERLADSDFRLEGMTLAANALVALGEIWLHDFPTVASSFATEFGGRVSDSIRTARLVKKFAAADADAGKIAVVCFAEDWKRYRPVDAAIADRLLAPRMGTHRGELPHSYQDVTWDELAKECPEIVSIQGLRALGEEYEYPAVLYRFWRCPLVHLAAAAHRTHQFTVGDEVMYMPLHEGYTSISFGPRLVTRWLRTVATDYVATCARESVIPAKDIDPGAAQEATLRGRWLKIG